MRKLLFFTLALHSFFSMMHAMEITPMNTPHHYEMNDDVLNEINEITQAWSVVITSLKHNAPSQNTLDQLAFESALKTLEYYANSIFNEQVQLTALNSMQRSLHNVDTFLTNPTMVEDFITLVLDLTTAYFEYATNDHVREKTLYILGDLVEGGSKKAFNKAIPLLSAYHDHEIPTSVRKGALRLASHMALYISETKHDNKSLPPQLLTLANRYLENNDVDILYYASQIIYHLLGVHPLVQELTQKAIEAINKHQKDPITKKLWINALETKINTVSPAPSVAPRSRSPRTISSLLTQIAEHATQRPRVNRSQSSCSSSSLRHTNAHLSLKSLEGKSTQDPIKQNS